MEKVGPRGGGEGQHASHGNMLITIGALQLDNLDEYLVTDWDVVDVE